MTWWLEGATFRHFGWVRTPPEALFLDFFESKNKRKKQGKNENSGEISGNIGKNLKIEISVEIFYQSPPKTKISPIFRPKTKISPMFRQKFSTFCPLMRTDYSLDKLVELYIKEIVRLHGIPISIISDRDPRFTSRFWGKLQEALGTRLNFSTAFHPQTDGQFEKVIQILEDMLKSCVIDLEGSWDRHIALVEFVYNNSFQSSIGMAPYEALYGRKCRTPLCWTELSEKKLIGPDLIQVIRATVG